MEQVLYNEVMVYACPLDHSVLTNKINIFFKYNNVQTLILDND